MTVFKSFLKVARRNIGSVAIYVIIMLVMSFIMLSYLGDTGGDLQVSTSDYKVAVINGDGADPLTQGLLSFLGSRAQLVPLEDTGEKAVLDTLFWREADHVLRIPAGFSQSLQTGHPLAITTMSSPNDYAHMYVDTYVNRFLATLRLYQERSADMDPALLLAQVNQDLKDEVMIAPVSGQGDAYLSTVWYFRYASYTLLAAVASGMGVVMAVLQKKRLVMRARVSSTSETSRNIQLFLAGLLYSSIIWLVLVILGVAVTRLPLAQLLAPRFRLILLSSFLYMLICMAISLVVSSFTQNRNVITGVNKVIALGSSFLGGVFVPVEVMGDQVAAMGKALPAYWYTQAVRGIGEAADNLGTALPGYWRHMGILGLMLAVLLAATLLINSLKRQRGL